MIKGGAIFGKGKGKTVILCEEFQFDSTEEELRIFRNLWNEGRSLEQIADELNRELEEIVFMIFDQAYKSKIEPREKSFLYGNPTNTIVDFLDV